MLDEPAKGRRAVRVPTLRRPGAFPGSWILAFYRSNVGKKYVMAITGIVLLLFVLGHMVGNLKLYAGEAPMNDYSAWLRNVGYPGLPHAGALWIVRGILLLSVVLHIHAATVLTITNRKARPVQYQSKRDFAVANYAARTMRWSGIIVGVFIIYHLLDLTFGTVNPNFVEHEPYHNVVESFQVWPIAIFYIVANLLLGLHIFHGAWSLFQSLGWNNRRFNPWRRYFAGGFSALVVLGNISFPIAVMIGIVD